MYVFVLVLYCSSACLEVFSGVLRFCGSFVSFFQAFSLILCLVERLFLRLLDPAAGCKALAMGHNRSFGYLSWAYLRCSLRLAFLSSFLG